jgi:hypothetical protein
MHKIETPFGYLCLPDERMTENAKTLYNSMRERKDLDVVTIHPQDTYTIKTPFGHAHTDRYESVLNIERATRKLRYQKFK